MKLRILTPLLILILLFVSCSEPIGYKEEITTVYFNPSTPESLIVSTSTFTNDSDYIINNDGSDGYLITMDRTDIDITFEFIAAEHIEHLYLSQYITSSTTDTAPFKELGTGHFILKKPIDNFKVPASGSYKFTVVRYYRT